MPSILTCLVGRWLCKQPTENHWELRYEAARLTLIRELYRDTHHIIDVATITIITVIIRLNWWLPFAPSMRSNTPSRPRSSHKNKTLTLDERYAKYRFGGAYQNLQPRVTKTLLHAFLDPKKPLTTHYGAIVGLSKLVRPRRVFPSLVQLHIPSLPHSLTTIVQGPNVIQVLLLPNIGSYVRMLTPILQEQEAAIKQLEAQKCHDALLVRLPSRIFTAQYSSTLHAAYSYIGTYPL